ncbi:MAG: beta-ketoacyl synthase N-terminal-like domain-containing protein, partial [Rhodospirillaceae bacterium]
MSAPRQAVIIAAKRTAFGKIGGMFRSRSALQLAGPVLRSLHRPFVAAGESVDEVLMGNVLAGGNVARGAALEAGLSVSCPALTLDRQCSSGLDAIVDAAWRIQAGAADRLLAGGVESSSTAPWRLEQPRSAREMPRVVSQAPFTGGGMADPTMIEGAEAAARWGAVSRDDQDKLALRSHAKALQAQADGLFAPELVSVFGQDPETDEGPKA